MATREENLKKINAKLEKLTDEQLEEVAGGSFGGGSQIRRDTWFLNSLLKGNANAPKRPEPDYSILFGLIDTYNVDNAAVKKAWDSLGIRYVSNTFGPDDYIVKETGKKLMQSQAWTYAAKLLGRE